MKEVSFWKEVGCLEITYSTFSKLLNSLDLCRYIFQNSFGLIREAKLLDKNVLMWIWNFSWYYFQNSFDHFDKMFGNGVTHLFGNGVEAIDPFKHYIGEQ